MTLKLPPLDTRPTPADLTIALCTIGRAGYLQRAISTLLATTPKGVRLHVVFNGADDGDLVDDVRRQIEHWDGPAEITELHPRLDIAGSHNTALEACTTDFVTFMGDDDLVLEPRVDALLERFWTTTPTPVVVGSFCRRVSGPPNASRFTSNKDYGPPTVAEWERVRASGELIEIVFPSAIYRTDGLRAIGGFEDRFSSAMDLVTFTRLGQHAPVLADRRRSFAHRIHDGSVTSSQASEHAMRLRYAEECMSALRDGRPEPSWERFREHDMSKPALQRLGDRRRTVSAAMFRQGGAAIASGARARGAAKAAAAAALSPSTFTTRSRAQVNSSPNTEPVVTILVKNCNQYRLSFYSELRSVLARKGIELRLVVGEGLPEDNLKGDRGSLPWAETRPIRVLNLAGKSLIWQPGFDLALSSDLLITEQASKQLFNTVLAYSHKALRTKMAFWGHGKNFQASLEGDSGEGLKRMLTKKVHWFFAYNDLSAQAAAEMGFPADRITSVMNSTDTTHIRTVRAGLPADNDTLVRAELGIGSGPVGLYLGGVYLHKRPEFLIDAALAIRERVPDFEMLVIGSGSLGHLMTEASERFDWFHSTGSIYGDERIRLASICDVQLMPGLVGLNVVDAFALGLPTITTDISYHSPEIEYLDDGVNGLITPGDATPSQYADAVADLLGDETRLRAMQRAATSAGEDLSIERMAQNFADGVVQALRDSE